MSINITSYNCRGLPVDNYKTHYRLDLYEISNKNYIVCLQETWYSKQDLDCINGLYENFHGFGTSTIDYRHSLVHGHHSGGVVIFLKFHMDKMFSF